MPTASVLSTLVPHSLAVAGTTPFCNSKVPGVGVGSTLEGGAGADSFEFNSYGLTSVKLYGNQDNDTIRLTGPTVETSLFGGKGEDSLQIRDTLTSSYVESNSGNDTIDVTARIENTFLHAGQGDDRFSLTGTVTNSTLVAGSGGDLLTFSNVVGGTSVKGSGSSTDSGNDTVVFSSSATDINVTFAEGADSLSLAKGATNATVAAGAGNDTVVAALTLCKQFDRSCSG